MDIIVIGKFGDGVMEGFGADRSLICKFLIGILL